MDKSAKEVILAGEEKLEIEVKPITMVFTAPNFNQRLSYPERFSIDTEATLHHIKLVKTFHEHTPRMVAYVFKMPDASIITPEWCRQAGTGVMHCAGLIDLSLKLCQLGVKFAWIHPESFLHPAAQSQLADIIVELALNPPKTLAEVEQEKIEELTREMFGEEDVS